MLRSLSLISFIFNSKDALTENHKKLHLFQFLSKFLDPKLKETRGFVQTICLNLFISIKSIPVCV